MQNQVWFFDFCRARLSVKSRRSNMRLWKTVSNCMVLLDDENVYLAAVYLIDAFAKTTAHSRVEPQDVIAVCTHLARCIVFDLNETLMWYCTICGTRCLFQQQKTVLQALDYRTMLTTKHLDDIRRRLIESQSADMITSLE